MDLRSPVLAFSALSMLTHCATSIDEREADQAAHVIESGKADNYYSNVSSEFEVSGSIAVSMTAEEAADETLRKEKIDRRLTAVAVYLTAYATKKLDGFFSNQTYGGFDAMVRNRSTEIRETTPNEEGMELIVTFEMDVAGPKDLTSRIAKTDDQGLSSFDLRMPKGATASGAGALSTIRGFNADTYSGELESIALRIEELPSSSNSYPEYASFFEDGVFDLTLFTGYDYNAYRTDLKDAERAMTTLTTTMGFTAPENVTDFASLAADSGPFTKTITVSNGQEVRIEVRIFHPDMFLTTRAEQKALALSELASRDVFLYAGHAGPYYGLYLDSANQAFVKESDLESAPMTSKKQLFVARGCQTYSQYADALYANPAKDETNLDVITTVNFSYGTATIDLIWWLTRVDTLGKHMPTDYYSLLSTINGYESNVNHQVMFGVIGTDDNPKVHPGANLESVGDACNVTADCGDTRGNVCLTVGQTKACGAYTLSESECPAGSRYGSIAQGATYYGHACY